MKSYNNGEITEKQLEDAVRYGMIIGRGMTDRMIAEHVIEVLDMPRDEIGYVMDMIYHSI